MGWTKRADALLALKRAKSELEKDIKDGLRDEFDLDHPPTLAYMLETLNSYAKITEALAFGRKDGYFKYVTGSSPNSEPIEHLPLVQSILCKSTKSCTFKIRRRKCGH